MDGNNTNGANGASGNNNTAAKTEVKVSIEVKVPHCLLCGGPIPEGSFAVHRPDWSAHGECVAALSSLSPAQRAVAIREALAARRYVN